jgi:hypothetical protein
VLEEDGELTAATLLVAEIADRAARLPQSVSEHCSHSSITEDRDLEGLRVQLRGSEGVVMKFNGKIKLYCWS